MARNSPFNDPNTDSTSRATILLVEDDAAIAFMLTDVLESTGYQVREASTGAEARGMVEQLRPDLIILDLVLPDAEGLEVARHILERQLAIPVVAISNVLDRPTEASSQEGIRRRVSMPFSARQILDAIRDS